MVRTRFAPSPTGYLHIGGVRTALFNWLYARQNGGQFILRVDDTDQARNVQGALAPILHGFRWLGIDWDEGPEVGGPCAPYYQSQRQGRYQAAVQELLASGHAYRDFAATEEIQAERESATADGRPFIYSRRWMAQSDAEIARFESEGRQSVVRLKIPRNGKLTINDRVRGPVEVEWASEQDHVIQRSDGSCLYHLASVVDDHDFQITHVIRAEEHLSNTPRQVFIARALGYELPQYAHLPYVAEPGSKNKLSKRKLSKYLKLRDFAALTEHGMRIATQTGLVTSDDTFNPVIVDFYEQIGFLPEAIVNYLLLLGWSLDDKTEDFSRDEMIRDFSLERVNKAPASFDPSKLVAFQERYMARLDIKKKAALVLPYLQRAGFVSSPPPCDTGPRLQQILQAAGDRIKVAGDILEFSDFFCPDENLTYDDNAFQKRIVKPENSLPLLKAFKEKLAAVDSFTAESLERELKEFVDEKQIKVGDIIHALRVAVTGKPVGFGMFETLEILGKERCLSRLELAISKSQQS